VGPQERSAVLTTAAEAPFVAFRIGIQYLRMKRSANKARGGFYDGLIGSGVPPKMASKLADEYVSGLSVRSLFAGLDTGSEDREDEDQ
jgi:hypothetical protein